MASELHDPRYRRLIELLVAARKSKGLTQRELAALSGRTQQYIGRYETCDREIGIFAILDMAAFLDVDGFDLAREAAASSVAGGSRPQEV